MEYWDLVSDVAICHLEPLLTRGASFGLLTQGLRKSGGLKLESHGGGRVIGVSQFYSISLTSTSNCFVSS